MELNRGFSKEEVKMTKRYTKKYATLLAVRRMQIKITLKFHFPPVRMSKVKITNGNKCWELCGNGTVTHFWWECKLVEVLWESVWRLLRRLQIGLYLMSVLYHSWAYAQRTLYHNIEILAHLCSLLLNKEETESCYMTIN